MTNGDSMRLDKYLKLCRIIKRRVVSKDIISFGQVLLNGRVAKPASQVNIGDTIILSLGNKKITIQVLSIDPHFTSKDAVISLYRILKEEVISSDSQT